MDYFIQYFCHTAVQKIFLITTFSENIFIMLQKI